MYKSEVVKRAHHRDVEETKSLLSKFRLTSRHSRMILYSTAYAIPVTLTVSVFGGACVAFGLLYLGQ